MVPRVMNFPFRDASLSIDRRLEDLLGRMTLAEKVGQLLQLDGRHDAVKTVQTYQPGSLLHILNQPLSEAMDAAAKTRLGIPLLIGEDGIHGHSFHRGATIFPTQLGMACAFDKDLVRGVARATAREMVTTGAHWTFSPVLCIARDPRWGRVDETFGEDPFLIGELGVAMVEGYQGQGLGDPEAVLATAKHYAGYSETQGGRDASEADLSERKLRSYFLPPFERAARAGCWSFMTGYQAIDGVPCTANRWLLTEVLREEWGFSGIVVTDWDNVGRLFWGHQIVPGMVEASVMAVRAGNDVIMATTGFHEAAQEAVTRGLLAEAEIDQVVRRILRLKLELGLFEDPRRPDPAAQARVVGCAEHRDLCLTAARESLVLLANDGLLPLDAAKIRRIAVIGPHADDDVAQLGDWSLGASQYPEAAGRHPRECTETILDGIRARAEGVEVVYAAGFRLGDPDGSGIAEAVRAVETSDLSVLVLGDSIATIGEGRSTATLELPDAGAPLLQAVAATKRPFVLCLVASKPLVLPEAAERASALLECFNPGMRGGTAVAELLFGDLNPTGKLPISFPRHAGQCPVHYNELRVWHGGGYADLSGEPRFAFGFGLSYTRYAYSNLRVLSQSLASGEPLVFEVDLENQGSRDGVEIAQAYLFDCVTSVTWPSKMLVGFQRVELRASEKKTVRFEIPFERLSLLDARARRVVEPGDFEILVGGSSRDRDLIRARFAVKGEAFRFDRVPGLAGV